jgi:hypothetical protein
MYAYRDASPRTLASLADNALSMAVDTPPTLLNQVTLFLRLLPCRKSIAFC